jgi:hypothetical protein
MTSWRSVGSGGTACPSSATVCMTAACSIFTMRPACLWMIDSRAPTDGDVEKGRVRRIRRQGLRRNCHDDAAVQPRGQSRVRTRATASLSPVLSASPTSSLTVQ